jgi:hypothetical protein
MEWSGRTPAPPEPCLDDGLVTVTTTRRFHNAKKQASRRRSRSRCRCTATLLNFLVAPVPAGRLALTDAGRAALLALLRDVEREGRARSRPV